MVERSRDWMNQALRDIENAEHELAGGFYEWASFSAQQAAEKAVKAIIQRRGGEAFGHSVAELLSLLPEDLSPNRWLIDGAHELDKAYISARYPNVHPAMAPFQVYTKKEARRLIAHARRIVEFCQGVLSRVRP